jgi:hypothetical protein
VTTEGQSTLSPSAARRGGDGSITGEPSGRDSYYGNPVIKEPIWKWEIPVYFFAGGLAGASAPLAAVAGLRGEDDLARRASVAAAVAGGVVSPLLLVSDLGVPRRFLNMLRVFKITSPMSVGAWVLAGFGPAAAAGAGWRLGVLPRRIGVAGEATAALLGPLLGTYTAALIATTAVPVWHEARHELPFVFAGSSLGSAGALGVILAPGQNGAARRMALAGSMLELGAGQLMEHRLGPLAEPYRHGRSGSLTRVAKALTVAGAAGTAVAGRRRRGLGVASASALLAAAFAERWAIVLAGSQSANDPTATVRPQRKRAATRPKRASRRVLSGP